MYWLGQRQLCDAPFRYAEGRDNIAMASNEYHVALGPDQHIEFLDAGRVRIVEAGEKPQEIWLDAATVQCLLDTLLRHATDIMLEAKVAKRMQREMKRLA